MTTIRQPIWLSLTAKRGSKKSSSSKKPNRIGRRQHRGPMPHLGSGVEPRQEAKNLFRLTRFGMINCFLVREDDGLTLIDTSLAGSAPGIRKASRTLGAPIRRIVLTHAHMCTVGSTDDLV